MTDSNFSLFPELKTDRLILRKLSEKDAEEIFVLRSDDVINKYLDRKRSKTIEDALKFIRSINSVIESNEAYYWAISLNGNDKLIGTICLFEILPSLQMCEIGYELMPNYQRQGFMKEAIEKVIEFASLKLGLKTIDAYTHKDNDNSSKLLQKLKFKKTNITSDKNPDYFVFRLSL